MNKLPKQLDIHAIEGKWQKRWEETGVYHFQKDKKLEPFSIDTPPPYPSGDFHMGNVLNWTYFDMLARFKRMRGFNVCFPQGWDCHGLGIEVQAERENKIKKRDMRPDEFRKLCEKLVNKYIAIMKGAIVGLGISVDWTLEYRTMDPDYWRRTQLSFIILYKKGLMYRGTHPVNWCTRCETAIADAEVNYDKHEGTLHYIKFKLEDERESLLIATTRPELITACVAVAVNPDDERFNKYIGKNLIIPIVNRAVTIIADRNVDPQFGTGIVMICTYGDKADVKTVLQHKLPVVMILTGDGRINRNGGKYSGMTVPQAKKAIVEDLKTAGLLERTERITQEIGSCDRCDSPVEILELKQWFMKTRALTEDVVENTKEVVWYPDYMKSRLIDWACSLDWDWVISRQRIFGTPIPVWYCSKCGENILAGEDWVPIDPKLEKPRIKNCPKCGGSDFIPERDVFDTWMDSSITCAVHAGWPDCRDWHFLFPADVHPSGIDIIRTWAYYLMVRHLALFGEKPYKSCLINGMVLGADGRKMSKSLKNYVAAPEILNKYGADASRQWAAGGGATGSDIPFRQPDVEYGWRFIIKLWNASSFVSNLLSDYVAEHGETQGLQLLDKWILSKTEKLIAKVTDAYEKCRFNEAIEETRNFTWHVFCDSYIEAAKDRLYKPDIYGAAKRRAAQHTLSTVLHKILQLLAPVMPHVTEEIYQTMFAEEGEYESIHLSRWPVGDESFVDEESEKKGDLIIGLIGEVRREKSEKHLALNATIKKLEVFAGDEKVSDMILEGKDDIAGTCKIENLQITAQKGEGREVKPYSIHFVAEY
jgi:valyl-tRNA synthetase